jgi:hypothetical protein
MINKRYNKLKQSMESANVNHTLYSFINCQENNTVNELITIAKKEIDFMKNLIGTKYSKLEMDEFHDESTLGNLEEKKMLMEISAKIFERNDVIQHLNETQRNLVTRILYKNGHIIEPNTNLKTENQANSTPKYETDANKLKDNFSFDTSVNTKNNNILHNSFDGSFKLSEIDERLKREVEDIYKRKNISKIEFRKKDANIYEFGSLKVELLIEKDKLFAKWKNGLLSIEEFVDINVASEVAKLKKENLKNKQQLKTPSNAKNTKSNNII